MRSSELTIDEIMVRLGDFDLCNAISSVIEDVYGYDALIMWPGSIALPHRLVHYVWSMTGYLECEGLARFFNLKCDHSAYPLCFECLGLDALARDIRNLLLLFPKCDLGNTDALIAHFGSWERIEEEIVSDVEDRLYQQSSAIENALAGYIRKNRNEFSNLLPQLRQRSELTNAGD